ncbi:MAG: HAMP domain-containing protein [Gemmatimonadetes bacterium]|nr:HAMP domain-containing protein [Gemmatimonadota bacterium]
MLGRKILGVAILPALFMTAAAILITFVQVREQLDQRTDEQLQTARRVLLDHLNARGEDLKTKARVVARDPKFFAMLAQPGIARDETFRATMQQVSEEFHHALGSDLFEVTASDGELLVRCCAPPFERTSLIESPDIRAAIRGENPTGIQWTNGALYETVALPILVGQRVVGVLRHGELLDDALAARIRDITNCDVTFLSDGNAIASSRSEGEPLRNAIESELPRVAGAEPALVRLEKSTSADRAFVTRLTTRIGLAGILMFVVTFFFARWITRRVTNPIDQLVEAARRLEANEEDLKLRIDTGDELGYLGDRFVQMRRALHEQIETLRELEQMKSRFITLASHELRTPATIIQGTVDLIQASMDDVRNLHPTMRELMPSLEKGVSRLQRVVGVVTMMAVLDSDGSDVRHEPVTARELFERFESDWRDYLGKRELNLHIEPPRSERSFPGDLTLLGEAVTTLVRNAIRYTPDGGHVTVRAEDGDAVTRLVVEDSGIGIPDAERIRIFESFYERGAIEHHSSGEEEFGSSGLGMGLAIARRIVQHHGGRIWSEDREGGGTRFQIELGSERADTRIDTDDSPDGTDSDGSHQLMIG